MLSSPTFDVLHSRRREYSGLTRNWADQEGAVRDETLPGCSCVSWRVGIAFKDRQTRAKAAFLEVMSHKDCKRVAQALWCRNLMVVSGTFPAKGCVFRESGFKPNKARGGRKFSILRGWAHYRTASRPQVVFPWPLSLSICRQEERSLPLPSEASTMFRSRPVVVLSG